MIGLLRNINFENPEFFLLLVAIPFLIWWQISKAEQTSLTISSISRMDTPFSLRAAIVPFIPWFRIAALFFMIIALARPQLTLKEEEVKAEGIDIMMSIDLSTSMLTRDFNPDRISVTKEVAADFVDKREYDRIGLTVFAEESFTQCPLTTDHRIVKDFLANLQCGLLADGTAIGMGLATAVNRIKDIPSASKVIILLTDGVNNSGYITPLTAAEIAKEFGIKVYTIGVGSNKNAMGPTSIRRDGTIMFGMTRGRIDEELLKEISEMTGGQYFRAADEASLAEIYDQIDRLEKTEIEVNVFRRYSEEFRFFFLIGLGLILLEVILRFTILRTIP
ncbi:vWA domain-containing protein [Portibacter marinus]|uniref:vWA domain-containing protein n=1 Tax=Portibacter marinus TaxID=2898660 RepID=UPI001F16DC5C|nr:VWA domain-containing protein [Portibacter marinus]